jgi:hypothetical protein
VGNVLINEATLSSIADAIREKNGSTETYKPAEMVEAIASIEGGGASIEDGIINGDLTHYKNDRITHLRAYAFYNHPNLISIDLPNVSNADVDKSAPIFEGWGAFEGCENLISVNLPKLTVISPNMFDGCKNLTTLNAPMVEEIHNVACNDCEMLESIYFPNLKLGIGTAFVDCIRLKKADLGTCATINNIAFRNTSLETLILRLEGITYLFNINAFDNTPIQKGTGYIYVLKDYIDAYRYDEKWSTYASQIRAIEDYPDICN